MQSNLAQAISIICDLEIRVPPILKPYEVEALAGIVNDLVLLHEVRVAKKPLREEWQSAKRDATEFTTDVVRQCMCGIKALEECGKSCLMAEREGEE